MHFALKIVSTRDLLELELTNEANTPLPVTIPKPRDQTSWSQLLHKDDNIRIRIVARTTTLTINGRKPFVILATITVADTTTDALLASWLIATESEDRSVWFPQIFDSSLTQAEIEEKLNTRSVLLEYVANA